MKNVTTTNKQLRFSGSVPLDVFITQRQHRHLEYFSLVSETLLHLTESAILTNNLLLAADASHCDLSLALCPLDTAELTIRMQEHVVGDLMQPSTYLSDGTTKFSL